MKIPEISIIIPTYNRDNFLGKTLASLVKQSFKDFEVLVCDDGGKTGLTDKITENYNKFFSAKYIWRKNNENYYNPAATRNFGANKAKGRYLLFLDCDIVLKPDSIEKMYRSLNKFGRSNKFHVTAGKRIHLDNLCTEDDIINRFSTLDNYKLLGFSKKYEGVSLSCAGIIKKDIFIKIGGFDEILFEGLRGQDLELMQRLRLLLDNETHTLDGIIYHLDNRELDDDRRVESGGNENLGREMTREKFTKMGFIYEGKKPVRDYVKHSKKYYQELLGNKTLVNKISTELHNKAALRYKRKSDINTQPEAEFSNHASKSKSPLVYIVILNYNGLDWLKKCLPSVIHTEYKNYKVMVVDNNSSDNSIKYVKENFPRIETLLLNKNLGYAGGNNQGMKLAFKKGADYIAVLNNDTTVNKDWLSILVNASEEDFTCGAAGPLILNGEGNKIQGPMMGFNNPTYINLSEQDITKIQKVGKLIGCAILFKRKALEKVGLFDRKYFCYQEEFDWCQRARYHGFNMLHAPQSRIMHYGFGTSARKKNFMHLKMRFLYSANEIRRLLKDPNKPLRKLLKYVTFNHYRNLNPIDKSLLLYIISYIYNIFRLPQIIRKRRIERGGSCYL